MSLRSQDPLPPVPDDMAGRLPTEVLEADELERHPPRQVPAAVGAAPAYESAPIELEPDEEAAVLERLRALGYVE